jgi:carboxyl-terminal processing protease
MLKITKKIAISLAIGTIVFIAFGAASFYSGFKYGAETRSIKITDSRQIIDADFNLFWEAVDLIKRKHIKADKVKAEDFLYGAIKGAIGALGDPYSAFYPPSDAKKLNEDLSGVFGGVGIEISIRNQQLVVVAPLKGTPAEEAGFKAGDKILKVDETPTANLTIEEAVKIIRGEPGTEVKLLILRDGWKEAKEFKIVRKVIVIPTLDWEMKNGNVAYIRLYNFNLNAPSAFYKAVLDSLIKGAKGYVIDLRNNPGGYLDVAVNLAGWFLKRGSVVVQEKFNTGKVETLKANGNEVLAQIPVVVIVNSGSASASEILTGALRDHRGIKVVGEKTFGKGSVQEVEQLRDDSAVKTTIAVWLTPNGSEIEGNGIVPDFEVKISDEDTQKNIDPQLEKALEVLRQEMAK